jgi:hypothetical protein
MKQQQRKTSDLLHHYPILITVHITKSNIQNISVSLYIKADWPTGCETTKIIVVSVQFFFFKEKRKYGSNRDFCILG